jgi:hypothetical protein
MNVPRAKYKACLSLHLFIFTVSQQGPLYMFLFLEANIFTPTDAMGICRNQPIFLSTTDERWLQCSVEYWIIIGDVSF